MSLYFYTKSLVFTTNYINIHPSFLKLPHWSPLNLPLPLNAESLFLPLPRIASLCKTSTASLKTAISSPNGRSLSLPTNANGLSASFLPRIAKGRLESFPLSANGLSASLPPIIENGRSESFPKKGRFNSSFFPTIFRGPSSSFLPTIANGLAASFPPIMAKGRSASFPFLSQGPSASLPPIMANGRSASLPLRNQGPSPLESVSSPNPCKANGRKASSSFVVI